MLSLIVTVTNGVLYGCHATWLIPQFRKYGERGWHEWWVVDVRWTIAADIPFLPTSYPGEGGEGDAWSQGRQNAISTTNTAFLGVFTACSVARVKSALSKTTFPSQKTTTAIYNSSVFNWSLVPVSSLSGIGNTWQPGWGPRRILSQTREKKKNRLIQMCAL